MSANKPKATKAPETIKMLRNLGSFTNSVSEIHILSTAKPKMLKAANFETLSGSNENGVINNVVIDAPHKIRELKYAFFFTRRILHTQHLEKPKGGPRRDRL